jgi:hypothetical protein
MGACELHGGQVDGIHFEESIRSNVLTNLVFDQHHGTRRMVETKYLREGTSFALIPDL